MPEKLTFTQQFLMAVAHGGPPTIAALVTGIVAYLKLKKRQQERHEQIVVLLNGSLEDKIKTAVEKALK